MTEKAYKVLHWEDVREGDELPTVSLPLTVTRLVMLANATRDFYAVHHDREYAQRNGARDMFLNNTAYAGFLSRFLTDWSGPTGKLRRLGFQMREMNCPGDVMTATGRVVKKYRHDGEHRVDVEFLVSNAQGPTTPGHATVALPSVARAGG